MEYCFKMPHRNPIKPFSTKEFSDIFSVIPRMTTDLLVPTESGILLAQRTIEPYIGHWYLPCGTYLRGTNPQRFNTPEENIQLIAQQELGTSVEVKKFLGTCANLKEAREPFVYASISFIYVCFPNGEVRPAETIRPFTDLPDKVMPHHREFLEKLMDGQKPPIEVWYY